MNFIVISISQAEVLTPIYWTTSSVKLPTSVREKRWYYLRTNGFCWRYGIQERRNSKGGRIKTARRVMYERAFALLY